MTRSPATSPAGRRGARPAPTATPSAPTGADPAGEADIVEDPVAPVTSGGGRAVWFVAAATALSLVLRSALAGSVGSPFIFQDEGGYVAVARLLVGDAPSLYGPTYHPVYGVLLAPAAAVLDPSGFHRAAQVLGVLAAAATLPATYLVARRIAGLRPWIAAGAAVVGTSTAASLLQATMLLPEALLGLFVVAAVLVVHHAVTSARLAAAVLAGAVVGLTYGVHPRAAVIVVALVIVAVLAWRAGVLLPRVAIALASSAVVTVIAVQLLHTWATSRLYEAGTWASLSGSPLRAVTEPGSVALLTAGQLWYLVVATVGLVPVGLVAVGQLAHARRGTARGITATFVVLAALGSLALGSIASYRVGLGDVGRADQPVYGRYIEQWIPVLVVFAPTLLRRWARPVVAATAAASAGLVVVLRWGYADDVWHLPLAWSNIASLRPAVDLFGRDYVLPWGLAMGVVVLGLLGAATTRRPALWALPLAAMLSLNVVAGTTTVSRWASPAAEAWAERHRLGPVLERADLPVAIDLDENFEVFYAYNLQFWHPGVDVVFTEEAAPAGVPLRIDSVSTPPSADAVLVGTERDGDIGLWAVEPAAAGAVSATGDVPGAPDQQRRS